MNEKMYEIVKKIQALLDELGGSVEVLSLLALITAIEIVSASDESDIDSNTEAYIKALHLGLKRSKEIREHLDESKN